MPEMGRNLTLDFPGFPAAVFFHIINLHCAIRAQYERCGIGQALEMGNRTYNPDGKLWYLSFVRLLSVATLLLIPYTPSQ